MIGIIDYEAGNISSVRNSLSALNIASMVLSEPRQFSLVKKIIIPGVGEAESAMSKLKSKALDQALQKTTKPVLGICLGMQLFFDSSEEGNASCLSIVPGVVKKITPNRELNIKVPHMGWNTLSAVNVEDERLSKLIDHKHYYFVHSYFCPINEYTKSSTHYGMSFASTVQKNNFLGVQFHPEKSGENGMSFLRYFCEVFDES